MRSPVHLKLDLAIRGVALSDELVAADPHLAARPTRDHASREIELLLPGDVLASCPVQTRAARNSPYRLTTDGERLRLVRQEHSSEVIETVDVALLPAPAFHERTTSRGTPMWQVGTVHAGYVSIDPALTCHFADEGMACRFCTLAATDTAPKERRRGLRPIDEVLEVIEAAFDEGAAEFVYMHTGYFDDEDGGVTVLEPYIDAVKKRFDTLVALQMHPPPSNEWIDRTYASGVDALSYAIEVHDPAAHARLCSGRRELVGRERYYEALAHAAGIFPSGTVWSDLIVGLEPPASTVDGIDALVAMGVLPVLSIFRPLDETELADHPLPEADDVAPLYAHLYRAVRDARINALHMRDLDYAITPLEARAFAEPDTALELATDALYRSRLGARTVRSLSRLRRRLRVRRVSESFDASHL